MQQLTNTCVHWLSMRPLTPLCPLPQDCCACPPLLCAAAVMTHPGLIWVSRPMQSYIAQLLHNVIYSTVFAHPSPKSVELLPVKKHWQPTMCKHERWLAAACQGARCWLHKVHCFLTAHMIPCTLCCCTQGGSQVGVATSPRHPPSPARP